MNRKWVVHLSLNLLEKSLSIYERIAISKCWKGVKYNEISPEIASYRTEIGPTIFNLKRYISMQERRHTIANRGLTSLVKEVTGVTSYLQ